MSLNNYIQIETLKEIISSNRPALYIDVRSPEEFYSGHIEGFSLIPVDVILQDPSELLDLRKAPSTPIYTICRSDVRSSGIAQYLSGIGVQDIYFVKDGVLGWTKAGYTLIKS